LATGLRRWPRAGLRSASWQTTRRDPARRRGGWNGDGSGVLLDVRAAAVPGLAPGEPVTAGSWAP
jgi:hypothetical protein